LKPVVKGDIVLLCGYDWVVLEVVDGKKALILSDKVLKTVIYSNRINILFDRFKKHFCIIRLFLNFFF